MDGLLSIRTLMYALVAMLAIVMLGTAFVMSFLPAHDIHPSDHPMLSLESMGNDRMQLLSKKKDYVNERSTKGIAQQIEQKREPTYFMVFSTSCSPFQNWQGLAFFHFAKKVQQPGHVTRIVSGCTPDEEAALKKVHAEKIAPLSDRFHMHVTPDFSVRDNQKYWNKPNGLLDYLEQNLGFHDRADDHKDDIIIVLDPDMMLLRPITFDFENYNTAWAGKFLSSKVKHGVPIAQKYGYGSAWLTSLKGNLSFVVGEDSPALKLTREEARLYYPAGPPYIATGKDMYAIAKHWVKFLPKVFSLFPEFMAEMHAYSIAAAHLKLPHQLAEGFMVSDVTGFNPMKREGFAQFLLNVTRADACEPVIPQNKLPLVLHYCQRYALGRWFFSKYKLPEDFFECKSPLLREPPSNVAEIYDWYVYPNGNEMQDMSQRINATIVNGWMLCTVVHSLNEVAMELKKTHCGDDANFEKTFQFHDEVQFQAALDDPSNPLKNGGK